MLEFSELTLKRACTSFKLEKTEFLPDHHPISPRVGERGIVRICKNPESGFDVFGVNGQSYWISSDNVIWGKPVHPGEQAATAPAAGPVATTLSTVDEQALIEQPLPQEPLKRKPGRPKKV